MHNYNKQIESVNFFLLQSGSQTFDAFKSQFLFKKFDLKPPLLDR